jgi:hypothetical protein
MLERLDILNARFTENELRCNMHILPIACFILLSTVAISGGSIFNIKVINSNFSDKEMPSKTLACIQQLKLDPHQGFNFDNWGGYIRYKIGIPVFIDDRVDFYGEPFYLEYGAVSEVLPVWKDILKKYRIKWILFPNNSRLVATLEQESDWKLVAKDPAASLFVLKPTSPGS